MSEEILTHGIPAAAGPRMLFTLDKHHEAVEATDVIKWSRWMSNNREKYHIVTPIHGYRVSTVFLGVNHNFSPDASAVPILFETMVWWQAKASASSEGRWCDEYQRRYVGWQEARVGHRRVCAEVIDPRSGR